jgi:hypothetical protein
MQYWPVESEEIAIFCKISKFTDLASFSFCFEEYWFDWSPLIFIMLALIGFIFLNEIKVKYTKIFVASNIIATLIYLWPGTIAYIKYFGLYKFSINLIWCFAIIVPFFTIGNIMLVCGVYGSKNLNIYYAIYIFLALMQMGWLVGLRAA